MDSGTYIYDKLTGQVVRVSDKIPSIKKVMDCGRGMNPIEEMRQGYKSLEEQGKLKKVDDREVQAECL